MAESPLQKNIPRAQDISTVVSLLPFPIQEKKPGLIPNVFIVPAAKQGDFEILQVSRARFPVYIDENRPALIVPEPSDNVCEAIVRDFKAGQIGFEAEIAEPGIFWVSGPYEKEQIKSIFKAELDRANALQMEWYKNIVRIADDDWERYHQHKFISSLQIHAVNILNLDRPYNTGVEVTAALSQCKWCFSQVNPKAVVCPACRGILDEERYKKEFKRVDVGA